MPKAFDFGGSEDTVHSGRQKAMLLRHGPELRSLMGPDLKMLPVILCACCFHLYMAIVFSRLESLTWILVFAVLLGPMTMNLLQFFEHEIGHNLIFGHGHPKAHMVLGLAVNLLFHLPTYAAYKEQIHHVHHKYQGAEGIDLEYPSWTVTSNFDYNATTRIGAFLWHFIVSAVKTADFSLRLEELRKPTVWRMVNYVSVALFDLAVIYFLGWKTFLYLILSFYLATGFHLPNFLETMFHTSFVRTQESNSVLCWWVNGLFFNIGYHEEHHDLPNVSCRKLPLIRATAPEFYDTEYVVHDFIPTLLKYFFHPGFGLSSRTQRTPAKYLQVMEQRKSHKHQREKAA